MKIRRVVALLVLETALDLIMMDAGSLAAGLCASSFQAQVAVHSLFFICLHNDKLAVKIKDRPLREVLKEIERHGEITVSIHGNIDEQVSMEFQEIPLDEGLRRILARANYLFLYGHSSPGETTTGIRLREVWVYPREVRAAREYDATWRGKADGELPLRREDLHDPDPQVRHQAVLALAREDGKKAIRKLIEILTRDESPEVRELTIGVAAEIEPTLVDPFIQIVLHDPEPSVRMEALVTMGQVAGEEENVREALRFAAKKDQDYEVRKVAAGLLEVLRDSGKK